MGGGLWNREQFYKVRVYPCGNFSDTPSLKLVKTKGSICHAFSLYSYSKSKSSELYPFILHEISILIELTLGHLR